ncbi:MAG: cysteine--tRNA ligase [Candidatus Magasanikbacteria bacterium RIFCSPHIGHO2_02_FULL_45_10]|uniref:Cysteine--tRNA ligase n=1 Tax=Candidatus Magasanikbacteria bacterium RIFCSPHIGHO2_02_FULL_45_10 TaxID=1798679 RepID=A0A1F6MAM6_9BACT|nr:MAG: cysteine--tRNA ligase [Candidatus Magasanikbacteria bacterium RIFCSPHIGHO2_02_FULL_45_10]
MILLYNTLTKKIEEFKPLKNKKVGLYACGPTVYHHAHIGNLRAYLFEDILKRVLIHQGFKVKHIMNITDVGHLTSNGDTGEDKMEKGSRREKKSAWEIAKFYTQSFLKDTANLNILPPDKLPRATDHIKEQINLIKLLEKKGFTYRTADGIYFDTSKLPDYGKLARLRSQDLKAGARVEFGEKKNITDFALWKFSPSGEKRQMEWKSPWGLGFPGWHIECSAMATKYLGQPFDIHAGGIDHIPVHHTNEIAQSEAAFDKSLANVWMHSEFLLISETKMAKSGDNFITLTTLIEKGFSPLAYRYFLLQGHYRKQLNFTWEALEAAQTGLERLYEAARRLPKKLPENKTLPEAFHKHITNDLDLPGGLALIWKAVNEKTIDQKTLLHFDEILGLDIKKNIKEKKTAALPLEIEKLVKQRDTARENKNWDESDRLRQELEQHGYSVIDTKEGTKIIEK